MTYIQIHKQTGAVVITRGVYINPDSEPAFGERPLFLHISGKSQEGVSKAESIILEMLKGGAPVPTKEVSVPILFAPHCPPSFNLVARIMGPQVPSRDCALD